jgi:hypothetical protein
MKLAEALAVRKAHKDRMEALKQRLYRNARFQEGQAPAEAVDDLLRQLTQEVDAYLDLVARINHTNTQARLGLGPSLTEALIRRDMFRYLSMVHGNLADKAEALDDRYSKREIRMLPAVDVGSLRRAADEFAKQSRLLDLSIQARNWEVELAKTAETGEVQAPPVVSRTDDHPGGQG